MRLVGMKRPLTIEELAGAIAIDLSKSQSDSEEHLMDPEEILELCGSLLRIKLDHTVVLAHLSVRENLTSKRLRMHPGLSTVFLSEQISTRHVSIFLLTYMFTIG
jgi:hypothetical protein